MAATLSDLMNCLQVSTWFTFAKHAPRTCESCGKGGDPRELLWQEMPGAARDTVAGRGRSHTRRDCPAYTHEWAAGHRVTHQPHGQSAAVAWVWDVQLNSS